MASTKGHRNRFVRTSFKVTIEARHHHSSHQPIVVDLFQHRDRKIVRMQSTRCENVGDVAVEARLGVQEQCQNMPVIVIERQ